MTPAFPLVRLGDIKAPGRYSMVGGPFGSKLVTADYVSEGVPVIRGANLPADRRFSFDDLVFVTEQKVERDLFGNIARPGDLVVTQRGTLGQVGLIPLASPYPEFVVSQSQMKLTVDPHKANAEFVYYALRSPIGQHEIVSKAISAGVPHINLSLFQQIRIPLPASASVQAKIAGVLAAYDELIENNNRRIAALEESVRRVYREWFVDFRFPGHDGVPKVESAFGAIPMGWLWRELRDIAVEVRDAVAPDAVDPDMPYVGLEHMPERSIALVDWGFARDAGSRKYRFKAGDTLFGKIRPYFHKVVVPPTDGICSTDAIVLRSLEPQYSGLVVAVVSSDSFVARAVQTSQGTKMPRANWAVLERTLIPVPPRATLERFSGLVADIVGLIHNLVLAIRALNASRDLLLPRLITGHIDVSTLDIPLPAPAA